MCGRLPGRIAKDRALKLSGAARQAALREAATIYRRISKSKPDYYPAINWASLSYLAGDREEGRRVAQSVLADPAIKGAADYWSLATRAEARFLLGERDAARADLLAAAQRPDADAGARSSTRRQLKLILDSQGVEAAEAAEILAPLKAPPTLYAVDLAGAGQGFGDFTRGVVRTANARIAKFLAELQPGAVFTSLGSPAEILFAEAALAQGVELNVMLELPEAAFLAEFIEPAGASWARRFKSCCRKARRVDSAADDATTEDPSLADYAARVAMGLTLLRAQYLDGEAIQVILEGGAGVDRSLADDRWREDASRLQIVLRFTDAEAPPQTVEHAKPRQCCAVVFGDLPGFSRLPESYLPIFWDTVMRAVGEVIGETGDAVKLKNTWGDAIHFVIPDVRRAAEICLTVQRRLSGIDGRLLGRSEAPTMRIGAHYGPVFEGWDPVAAQHTYYGRALSRAARIEPITPPGTVYVTEAFAAILLLESRGEFTCTYVGRVPLAKGYGTFRMYDLKAEQSAT